MLGSGADEEDTEGMDGFKYLFDVSLIRNFTIIPSYSKMKKNLESTEETRAKSVEYSPMMIITTTMNIVLRP